MSTSVIMKDEEKSVRISNEEEEEDEYEYYESEDEEQARWEQNRYEIMDSLPEYAKGKYAFLDPQLGHGGQHEHYYVVDGCAECNGLTKGWYDTKCCDGSILKYDEYYDCCMYDTLYVFFSDNGDTRFLADDARTWDGFLEIPDVRFVYAFWEKLGRVVEELSKKQAKSGSVYRWHVVQLRTQAIKDELLAVVWQYGSPMMRYEMGDRFR